MIMSGNDSDDTMKMSPDDEYNTLQSLQSGLESLWVFT